MNAIRICNSFANLQHYLQRAGNHYLDSDTLRFFRSREVCTLGNGAMVAYVETMGAGFDRRDGRIYKASSFEFIRNGDGSITVKHGTLYHGGEDGNPSMSTQRKRAMLAARQYVCDHV